MPAPAQFAALLNGYDSNVNSEGYYFDAERATDAVYWIQDHCTHVKGELQRQPLELAPWEVAMVCTLFGWYDEKTHLRRYREAFLYVPRKNSKTTSAAAIGLYVLDTDNEPGYEASFAAYNTTQAKKFFEVMCGMIRQDPWLAKRYRVYKQPNHIVPHHDVASSAHVITSDADTAHGSNLHLAVVDEVHKQKDHELIEALTTSMGTRRQPLGLYMTTADEPDDPDTPCNKMYARAKAIKAGTIKDPTFLPIVYEAELDDDWTDLDVWRKANPNFGLSIKEEYAKRIISEGLNEPHKINGFKRLHLNIQIGSAVSWLRVADFSACSTEPLQTGPCFAGLDLASTDDLTGFVLFWPDTWSFIARMYLPERTARDPRRRFYRPWIDAGWLIVTEGDTTDYTRVRADIVAAHQEHHIQALGYDTKSANEISRNLYNVDNINCVPIPQNMATLSEPAKAIEVACRNRILRHGGNKCMIWQAGNVKVRTDDIGNILPSKKHSAGKIDGIAALVTAKAVAMTEEPPVEMEIITL
jgi:phage terminase large subunit-like protein